MQQLFGAMVWLAGCCSVATIAAQTNTFLPAGQPGSHTQVPAAWQPVGTTQAMPTTNTAPVVSRKPADGANPRGNPQSVPWPYYRPSGYQPGGLGTVYNANAAPTGGFVPAGTWQPAPATTAVPATPVATTSAAPVTAMPTTAANRPPVPLPAWGGNSVSPPAVAAAGSGGAKASPGPAAPATPDRAAAAGDPNGDPFLRGIPEARFYDLTPYTAKFAATDQPETAVLDWIHHEFGTDIWHRGNRALLNVARDRVEVYHAPEMQQKIAQFLGHFLAYQPGLFNCRVQVLSVDRPQWRDEYLSRLESLGSVKTGSPAWLLGRGGSDGFVTYLTRKSGGTVLLDQRFAVVNGQRADIRWATEQHQLTTGVSVPQGPGRTSFRPQVEQTNDGVFLAVSPLIGADGASVNLRLKASVSQLLDSKKVRLDLPNRPKVDVPDLRQAEVSRTFQVPLDRPLVLSLGLAPKFDAAKRWFSMEGRAELLILVEIAADPRNQIDGRSVALGQSGVEAAVAAKPTNETATDSLVDDLPTRSRQPNWPASLTATGFGRP